MPEISEEEFREYMALKTKESERQRAIDEMIKKGTHSMKKWRDDLTSIQGRAGIFAKILNREHERRGYPDRFMLDRLTSVFNYLPDDLLIKLKGRIYINKHFRNCLMKYGWRTLIHRKHGLFEVIKV